MSYSARRQARDWRRRGLVHSGWVLESLEERKLMSGTSASLAASQAQVSSITVLQTSLKTAVTGSKVTFSASVENASTNAPITSGKVDFVVQAPQKIVLGEVSVDKQGQASVSTDLLTKIANYQVEAKYTPSKHMFAASVAAPVSVKVIPLPLQVPTTITVESGAPIAETGQFVPLVAALKDAGTGNQVNAGRVATISGTVEFLTDSPRPIILSKVPLNLNLNQTTSALSSTLLSIVGVTSTQATINVKDAVSISTNKLKEIGPNQIEAKFLPANKEFTASTSAPETVTITHKTHDDPTVTTVTTATNRVETGEAVALNMTVQDANSSLAGGTVKFTTVSPHPVLLAKVAVNAFDQPVSLATNKLQIVGTYQIEASYTPDTTRFAKSTSAPVTIAVTPLTAASFRVTPTVRHEHLNEPVTFQVTALDAQGQPLTNYTGTVALTSPTDSWTVFPTSVYESLAIGAPSPQSTGLATFTTQNYTFTAADQGTHTFVGGVTFEKGGAEVLQVSQANDAKVHGQTTIWIS
jgi:hypothetical protein